MTEKSKVIQPSASGRVEVVQSHAAFNVDTQAPQSISCPVLATGSRRIALLTLGWASLVVGVLGIFLPLLPTTVFVLLAAWCFARSSLKLHVWLQSHSTFGPMVRAWQAHHALPKGVRPKALTVMWGFMLLSMFLVGQWWAVVLLVSIGASVTWYLCSLPEIEV